MCRACEGAFQEASLLLAEQLLLAEDTGYQGATRPLNAAERRAKIRFGDLDRMEQSGVRAARAALEGLRRTAVDAIMAAVGSGEWVDARRLVSAVESLARREPTRVAGEAARVAGILRGLLAETYASARTMAAREARAQGVPESRAARGGMPTGQAPGGRHWETAAAGVALTPWQKLQASLQADFTGAALAARGGVDRATLMDTLMDVSLDGPVDEARQAMHQAIGAGRVDAANAIGPSAIWASELLDGATCPACAVIDGQEYDTVEDAREDYPLGGYRLCDGGPRCRGTLVFEYGPGDHPPEDPPPSVLDDLPGPDAPDAPQAPGGPDADAARRAASPGGSEQEGEAVLPLPDREPGEGQRLTDWGQVELDPELADMDPEAVALGTNPRQAEGIDYKHNCTSCVTAWEARRRGLNVTAAPVANGKGRAYSEWSQFFSHRGDSRTVGFADLREGTRGQLEKAASADPDGARYIVQVRWKGAGGGHVFTAEKRDGALFYVEPQASGYSDASRHWDNVRGGKANMLRVDDKDLTDRALQTVVVEPPDYLAELGRVKSTPVADRVATQQQTGATRLAETQQLRAYVAPELARLRAEAAAARPKGTRKPGVAEDRRAVADITRALERRMRAERRYREGLIPESEYRALVTMSTRDIDRYRQSLR